MDCLCSHITQNPELSHWGPSGHMPRFCGSSLRASSSSSRRPCSPSGPWIWGPFALTKVKATEARPPCAAPTSVHAAGGQTLGQLGALLTPRKELSPCAYLTTAQPVSFLSRATAELWTQEGPSLAMNRGGSCGTEPVEASYKECP